MNIEPHLLPDWELVQSWADSNLDGNPAYIFNITKAADLHRTMNYARERMVGNLALLIAAGQAYGVEIDVKSELEDLKEKTKTFDFEKQVQKKWTAPRSL